MTKQTKQGWEEEEKEYNQVLRRAYAQKENVDAEKLLKGFRAKSTDPNGWDFLSSWTWNWIEKKLSQAYKRGREDEAIECQKDMERVVEETKREVMKGIKVNQKEFVKLANEVSKILEEEKRTMTGAYDVTTRAGKKRFRDMLRELVE